MGRRGPRPAPTAMKRARGVRPDRIASGEPVPEPTAQPPSPPRDLSPEAKGVWRRLVPGMHAAGVLTAWDVDLFAVYCDLVVRARRARELLDPALLITGRRDGLITNPAWRIYRD